MKQIKSFVKSEGVLTVTPTVPDGNRTKTYLLRISNILNLYRKKPDSKMLNRNTWEYIKEFVIMTFPWLDK